MNMVRNDPGMDHRPVGNGGEGGGARAPGVRFRPTSLDPSCSRAIAVLVISAPIALAAYQIAVDARLSPRYTCLRYAPRRRLSSCSGYPAIYRQRWSAWRSGDPIIDAIASVLIARRWSGSSA